MADPQPFKEFNHFNHQLTLIFWNMNGVKEKFKNEEVQILFSKYDVLIIMETHFKVRHRCPEEFEMVGKSVPICEKTGRGGVAVYARKILKLSFHVYHDICPEALVMKLCNTNVVIIAPYVVPDNSKFKVDKIFSIINFIIQNFPRDHVYMMGDMNARCATPDNTHTHQYIRNPDNVINSNGRKLMSLCAESDLVIVNGLKYRDRQFDTNFTYHRGNLKSQNDWCVTNHIESVRSFEILEKLDVSDHNPCGITLMYRPTISLELMGRCADGNFSYESHDKSKRVKKKIRLDNIVVSSEMMTDFNELGRKIKDWISTGESVHSIAVKIDDIIYEICERFVKKGRRNTVIPASKASCSSKNFYAIADANLKMYTRCVEDGVDDEETLRYLLVWQENKLYAELLEAREYNVKENVGWKSVSKKDPRKMWKMIDYKDSSLSQKRQDPISPQVIHKYFKSIFQADHLASKPTVDDVLNELQNYHVADHELDVELSYADLNLGIKEIGRGIGLDGLDKSIVHLFPKQLRESILQFFNLVFDTEYPLEWIYLILRPEVKKGHSSKNPKLRGVAISSLLATLYDIIMDNRFKPWYKINPEQAGFRELQGCLVQIFCIYLLMELAKSLNETIFIGFIDYEKAFDFVNRCDVVRDLMSENAGSKFVRAVASMYMNTYYVPKVSDNSTGEPILARHGVTQGRKSSTSLFSFIMRNIPRSIKLKDSFLQGNHVFQLADDSSIATNLFSELETGFGQAIDASDDKFMVTNTDKMFYLHLCNDPVRDDMKLANGCTISSAVNDEHLYLGMWFMASSEIWEQILCNFRHRSFNVKKFCEWLDINTMTPVNIKIHVLDACMFAAYLYGCECWSMSIDEVRESILAIERKLLKMILQVKPSTPNELLYVELGRCDVMCRIKQRQKRFFERCKQLTDEDAILSRIMNLCTHLDFYKYYESLADNLDQINLNEMKSSINNATTTYCMRYKEICGMSYNDCIYGQDLREDKRIIITKWRLSSHNLKIETGRYTKPPTARDERVCSECTSVVEDEHHVVFQCPLYRNVQTHHRDLLLRLKSIPELLNPKTIADASEVGEMLLSINSIRRDLGLCQ